MANDPNKGAPLAPPPRLTGNMAQDLLALREWVWTLYNSLAEGGVFLLSSAQPARFPIAPGQVTFSENETGKLVQFAEAQPDTSYFPQLTVIDTTGAPAAGALQAANIAKTVDGFTVTIGAAPGANASVTYSYLVTK